jgi:hypothetical protein
VTAEAALHDGESRDRLDVLFHQGEIGVYVATVEGVEPSVGRVKELLRHARQFRRTGSSGNPA